jgi:carboxyl-terminal processing protease
MIRGKIGTSVRLSLERTGQIAPIDLSLTRAEVRVDSVLGDMRKDDDSWVFHLQGHPEIGYIRIGSEGFSPRGGFGDRTAEEIKAALATLDEKKLKGLILDLRFNGGGRLDAAIDVCSQFLPPGEIVVTTRGRDGRILSEERSSGPGTFRDVPMVVLVNSMSASASEIVAACLQDHHRAAIAGQRSYGKGTVQKVLPVEGNQSVLKLTTATYWRPSNKNIHRDKDAKESDEWGVVPEKELALALNTADTEKVLNARAERDVVHRAQSHPPAADVDAQLQRAVEYLEKAAKK